MQQLNKQDDFQDLEELIEDELDTDSDDTHIDSGGGRRRIFTDKLDPKISGLHQSHKAGDLVLDPTFQRRKVWDDARSSRLIESALLEVPLPIFYLAENQDGTEEVIDGQQRLNAFFRYLDNGFALRSLKELRAINGKFYRDLEEVQQKQLRNCSVRTIVFKKESDEGLRFQIFERLNTGAMPLNAQELRNCIYRGSYNNLLHSLSSDPDYMANMGFQGPEKRMRDVEYVLRFAAFHHASYLNYRPSMERFMNEDMKKFRNISSEDSAELSKAFKNAVTLVRSLFGKNAFKRYYRGNDKAPNGRWEPKKFNASIYDILMWTMARVDKNRVMARLDAVREALLYLMTEDPKFIEAIELSTSSVGAVQSRFDRWRKALDTVLEPTSSQPRCFSRALKQELYDQDATCSLCGQHIVGIDDAAVDHIEMYWLGGQTIPENARLTHRYCNWARPKVDS